MVKGHSAREETHSCHMGYSFQLVARVLLYASSYIHDSTYHVEREIAQWVHHEGLIQWPIAPLANALTMELQQTISVILTDSVILDDYQNYYFLNANLICLAVYILNISNR